MEKDLIAAGYKELTGRKETMIAGVVGIQLQDGGSLIAAGDPAGNLTLAEDPLRGRELKLHAYYPKRNGVMAMPSNRGMFEGGNLILDGRLPAAQS
jgi:hypothetical protein